MPLIPENQITTSAKPVQSRRSGLAFPVGSNTRGGLSTVVGNDSDIKTIAIALGSLESENAFQQPAFDIEDAIFGLDDQGAQAFVRRKLNLLFKQFEEEDRFRLLKNTLTFSHDVQGELTLDFKFHNLESDETHTISHTFGGR